MTQDEQQNQQADSGKLHWHPAFQGAMQLAWRKNKHDLEIQGNVHLGKLPSIMDLLVIVKKPGLKLEDPIGAGFRGLNILEFKSPRDDMNIDTFFKVLSYACLYKSQGSTVDARQVDDMTITLMRATLPNNLLQNLEQAGGAIARQGAGIYSVRNLCVFDTRIIAYDELPEYDDYVYLKSLSENITHDLGKKLISMGEDFKDEDDKRDANAVLYLTMKKHQEVFRQIVAEGDMVFYDAYREFFRDVIFADEIARMKAERKAEIEAEVKAEVKAEGKVLMAIGMGRNLGLSDDEIIGHIASNISCSQAEATSLFQKYENARQTVSA